MPIRTHDNFGHSLAKLIQTIKQLSWSLAESNEIILHFGASKMLNPFFIGGLLCVIRWYEELGKKFHLNHDDNSSINSYLKAICFPKTCTTTVGNAEIFFRTLDQYRFKTFIPIISFNTGDDINSTIVREHILSSLSELLKNQLSFSGRERMPLSYFLDELTNNINDHSASEKGYIFAQSYHQSHYLDLCICDSGKGIFQSYLDNPKFQPQSEAEAIGLALSGHSTKDRPEARGFGISTSINMLVNGLGGKLFLWSGNTTFMKTIEKEAILTLERDNFFQGTFIAIRLPTSIPARFDFYKFTDV